MKKNTLYTVNKWNRPAFLHADNIFNEGGVKTSGLGYFTSQSVGSGLSKTTLDNFNERTAGSTVSGTNNSINAGQVMQIAGAIGGAIDGFSAAYNDEGPQYSAAAGNGFSLVDQTLTGGKKSKEGMALVNAGAGMMNSGLYLPGGIAATLGTILNNAIGYSVANEQYMKKNAERLGSAKFGAANTDDLIKQYNNTDLNVISSGKVDNGLLTNKGTRIANELMEKQDDAYEFAMRGFENAAYNIGRDNLNNNLANYSAFGGPLYSGGSGALDIMQQDKYINAINNRSNAITKTGTFGQMPQISLQPNRYDLGGLKAAFIDNFQKNPLGAVLQYNQGLENLAAEREAEEAAAAREKQLVDMQKQLLELKTENEGRQAIMEAMSVPAIEALPEPERPLQPAAPVTLSKDASSNWKYIEDQLRKSGKFNDVQIEGIKYNLQRESALGTADGGDNGTARGLAQWRGDRIPSDMSLAGQTQYLIDTLSNYDGRLHWIGRGNYDGFMNARTPEEAHYYIAKGYERPANRILNKVKRESDMSLRNINAFGGELGTNGTDWKNGLIQIGTGGTHEQNPLQGVQMGVDGEGVPNLVEEGETVYNDYVFSDRMIIPKSMRREFGLGGSMKKDISFADASKKLAQESEQRPNDPISKAGLEASLAKLAQLQETERMRRQMEEYVGFNEYAYGGKKGNIFGGDGSKVNLAERGSYGAADDNWGYPMYMVPWNGEGLYRYYSYKPIDKDTRITNRQRDYTAQLMAGENKDKSEEVAAESASAKTVSNKKTASKTTAKTRKIDMSSDYPHGPAASVSQEFLDKIAFNVPEVTKKEDAKPVDYIEAAKKWALEHPEQAKEYWGITPGEYDWIRPADTTPAEGGGKKKNTPELYPTWMRYAPVAGASGMVLADAFGLTNKPDYTYADQIAAAANAAGYAPNIKYEPIGDYMRYTPFDTMYYANQLQANARATDRALLNSSSPSRDAGLLANGYNTVNAMGDLYRKAEEYNLAQRQQVADFNRKTNMFNSQMGLEADMANARYRQGAASAQISGLAQAAALRDSIDARTGAAKSANIKALLDSLKNIGSENMAYNMINTDNAFDYGIRRGGITGHKSSLWNNDGKKKKQGE